MTTIKFKNLFLRTINLNIDSLKPKNYFLNSGNSTGNVIKNPWTKYLWQLAIVIINMNGGDLPLLIQTMINGYRMNSETLRGMKIGKGLVCLTQLELRMPR